MKSIAAIIFAMVFAVMPALADPYVPLLEVDDDAAIDYDTNSAVVVRTTVLQTVTITLPYCSNGRNGYFFDVVKTGLGTAVVRPSVNDGQDIDGNANYTISVSNTGHKFMCVWSDPEAEEGGWVQSS